MDDDDELISIDQASLIQYIRTALEMDGIDIPIEILERILNIELEYLQHKGIAEQVFDDPRPE